jgi:hypothetical protein
MKTRGKILVGVISVMAVFVAGLIVWAQQPSQVKIAITGHPGLAFTGVIKTDGALMPVSGVVPTNYVVIARSVDCRFRKQQTGGALGVNMKMTRLGGTCTVTTSESGKGVSAFLSLHSARCNTF